MNQNYPVSNAPSVRVIQSVNWPLALGINSHFSGGYDFQSSGYKNVP